MKEAKNGLDAITSRRHVIAGGLAVADTLGSAAAQSPSSTAIVFGTTDNPLRYPRHVNNASTAVAMQKYGKHLCRGTKVLFGVITVGPVPYQLGWLASNLSWYGDDLYEFPKLRNTDGTFSKKKVTARLYQNLRAWQKVTYKRSPAIRICETNSPYDEHRSEFFTTIADWLARHNGSRMLTYWNPREGLLQGGLSGPWPPGEPVIRRLVSLSQEYKRSAR